MGVSSWLQPPGKRAGARTLVAAEEPRTRRLDVLWTRGARGRRGAIRYDSPPSALLGLARCRIPGRGVAASQGDHFKDAIFGRDSLQVARDVMDADPDLVREVILTLAQLQGTKDVPAGYQSSEEEVGRIHHEMRWLDDSGGRRVSDSAAQRYYDLTEQWGGWPYYGAVDATPLYVLAVAEYCERYGRGILDQTYVDRSGTEQTIRHSVVAANAWIHRRIDTSPMHLLDFHRKNPVGIEAQNWTDGKSSMMDIDGLVLNPDNFTATPELQSLAFDALTIGGDLLRDTNAMDARSWRERALALRDYTLDLFWMDDEMCMAMAVTTQGADPPRQLRIVSGLGAEMLDSHFFDDLPREQQWHYVSNIARSVCAEDFVNEAGIRCKSLRHENLADFWPYQGSNVAWYVQTGRIINGLHRWGLHNAAYQLEVRVVNTTNATGNLSEFAYVDHEGRAILDPGNARQRKPAQSILATNLPDATQAWTISAVLRIKRRWRDAWPAKPQLVDDAQRRLDHELVAAMPSVRVWTAAECRTRYGESPARKVRPDQGVRREAELIARSRSADTGVDVVSLDQRRRRPHRGLPSSVRNIG